ncbi:hypothetical protein B0H19DRAFT_694177 [Mycena capillaripes]|nr:hypothetical protein B0H19DRAFT_694177 [Mycena capillaripes]
MFLYFSFLCSLCYPFRSFAAGSLSLFLSLFLNSLTTTRTTITTTYLLYYICTADIHTWHPFRLFARLATSVSRSFRGLYTLVLLHPPPFFPSRTKPTRHSLSTHARTHTHSLIHSLIGATRTPPTLIIISHPHAHSLYYLVGPIRT